MNNVTTNRVAVSVTVLSLLSVLLIFPQPCLSELLAYEGFNNYTGSVLATQGGVDWTNSWWGYSDSSPAEHGIDITNSVDQSASPFLLEKGMISYMNPSETASSSSRYLPTPLITTVSTNYYISFLYRRVQGIWADVRLYGGANPNEGTIEIGGSYDTNRFQLGKSCGGSQMRVTSTSIGFTNDVPFFVIAKLSMNADDTNDYIYASIYKAGEKVETEEPDTWDIANTNSCSHPFDTVNVLYLRCGEMVEVQYDEFRIGTTWEDVAVAPPKGLLMMVK